MYTNSIFTSIDASASGLTAQRLRMDLIAGNIANVDTTRTPEGGPFKRQLAVFASKTDLTMRKFPFMPMKIKTEMQHPGDGVKVLEVMKDPSAPRLRYEPGHPDANNEGYVAYPNVDVVKEMVDMISASRAYEANITSINSAKNMALKAMSIGK
ncbi:MAG TPA: flagellar basal body rod protein FlgC [bacterium]|nr:flagellar basal body rod protein FlgC [bacterium]